MAKTPVNKSVKGYVDLYLLPLPKKNLAKYRSQAMHFGKMARKYGALEYREFLGEDLSTKWAASFASAVKLGREEILVASVVGYKSRSHRDKVLKAIYADPHMKEEEKRLFDIKKMYYGGFETFLDA